MIRCLAIDDESLALDLLEDNISKIPFLSLAGRCKNVYEAQRIIQSETIDLVFLDIQMPGTTGVQFLQGQAGQFPLVIFVTAYENYALEGFNLNVVDYLLKPVPFERFLRAVNKAQKLLETSLPESTPDYLFVNADYSLVKVTLSEIRYIEGLKDYVKIHLEGQTRPIVTRITMKALEEKLPASAFLRVHKSFIVAFSKIESIRNLRIKIGQVHIPVSELHSEALMNAINNGRLE